MPAAMIAVAESRRPVPRLLGGGVSSTAAKVDVATVSSMPVSSSVGGTGWSYGS